MVFISLIQNSSKRKSNHTKEFRALIILYIYLEIDRKLREK